MNDNNSSIMINTRAGIEAFRLLTIYHALKLEAATGMRHSRVNMLKAANVVLKATHRTKKKALAALKAHLTAEGILTEKAQIKQEN